MIEKIKTRLLVVSSLLALGIPALAPLAVSAQQGPIQGGLCKGAQQLVIEEGEATCQDPNVNTSFTTVLKRVINILSVIIGVIAVIMIIIGGFRYITSGGTSEKVTGAKNTILYAIIGLIIVALAQIIVRFVLSNTPS